MDDKLIINKVNNNYVLGIRVNFPKADYNSFATIRPNFAISSYAGNQGSLFTNKGILKNVGSIKAIKIYVKGRNFYHSLSINLQDENFIEKNYSLGNLKFDGWRELVWSNQNYIENVRDRTPKLFPRYSEIEPLRKFNSLVIFRNGEHKGGNFITYVSWIKVEYDKAYIPKEEEIDDEEVWKIQTDLYKQRNEMEQKRLNLSNELRQLELQKMNRKVPTKEQDNTSPTTPESEEQNDTSPTTPEGEEQETESEN